MNSPDAEVFAGTNEVKVPLTVAQWADIISLCLRFAVVIGLTMMALKYAFEADYGKDFVMTFSMLALGHLCARHHRACHGALAELVLTSFAPCFGAVSWVSFIQHVKGGDWDIAGWLIVVISILALSWLKGRRDYEDAKA